MTQTTLDNIIYQMTYHYFSLPLTFQSHLSFVSESLLLIIKEKIIHSLGKLLLNSYNVRSSKRLQII